MKKRKLLLAALLLLCAVLFLTACGGSGGSKKEDVMTLERYMSENAEAKESLEKAAASNPSIAIQIKGNNISYVFDYQKVEGMTEESAKATAPYLESALENADSTYTAVCKNMQEQTKIEGITATISYTWGDYVIVSHTYDIDGLVE